MHELAAIHDVTLTETSIARCTKELIEKVAEKSEFKTVDVLIDEYDQPLTANFDSGRLDVSLGNREVLASFYQQFKPLSPAIGLMWVTGVAKFSTMNDLDDITLEPAAAALFGYTWEEIEKTFPEHLEALQKRQRLASRVQVKELLTAKYNGYSWDGETRLYNPWDINCALKRCVLDNYWNMAGQPSFLMSMLNPLDPTHKPSYWENERRTMYVLNICITASHYCRFDTMDVESFRPATEPGAGVVPAAGAYKPDMASIFLSTGLLTVNTAMLRYDGGMEYTLKVPNMEVRELVSQAVLKRLMPGLRPTNIDLIRGALREDNIERFLHLFNEGLSTIPYLMYGGRANRRDDEAHYHEALHWLLWFAVDGNASFFVSEGAGAAGRGDIYLRTPKSQYVFELKVDTDNDAGFKQMIERQYASTFPPVRPSTPVYLVCCVFNSSTGSFKFKPRMLRADKPDGMSYDLPSC